MKKFFLPILFLLLIFATAANALGLLEITTRETNLYNNAGKGWTDNRMCLGAVVEQTAEIKNDWYPVRMRNGEEGWVPTWVAQPAPSGTKLYQAFHEDLLPRTDAPLYGEVIVSEAYFRYIPYGGLSGKFDTTRVGSIPNGAVLKLTDKVGHWFKVQFSPVEYGWVYDENLRPTDPPGMNSYMGAAVADMKRIQISATHEETRLTMQLTDRMPFSAVSNTDPDMVKFKIYGVSCNSLVWRWNSQCIKSGGWCSCSPWINVFEGYIPSTGKIAGFDARYEDNDFVVTLRKSTEAEYNTIVLDPGHGAPVPFPRGYAEGAHGKNCMEHELVVPIAQKAAEILREKKFNVILTREGPSEEMMDLYERNLLAVESRADLFVSIHANGDVDKELTGVEVYWHEPQSRRLAEFLAVSVAEATHRPHGLALFASFSVARETRYPAVLLETGYLTNPEEGALLCDPEFQAQTAQGIADGITTYIDFLKNK